MYIHIISQMNYIKLDSGKRINRSTTGPGEFILPLLTPLSGAYLLKQIVIPLSFFNVNQTNNLIYFYENGTAKTAELEPGYYDDATLLVQLKDALDYASGGFSTFTITRSQLPLRIMLSSTNNFQLTFGSNTVNSAAEILGFSPIDTQSFTFHMAANISNLSTLRSFSISVNNENGFSDSIGNACTFVIPILGISNSIQIYEPSLHYQQRITFNSSTTNLIIKVCDDNNATVSLFADWYMILEKLHC
jgi:hypothetical protein